MKPKDFKKLAKRCPWYENNGRPVCTATARQNKSKDFIKITRCTEKACAPLYWIKVSGNWVSLSELTKEIPYE